MKQELNTIELEGELYASVKYLEYKFPKLGRTTLRRWRLKNFIRYRRISYKFIIYHLDDVQFHYDMLMFRHNSDDKRWGVDGRFKTNGATD